MKIKNYIVKIIFFITPVLFCMIILEVFLINIPNDYKYKRKYMDENASNIETIIFGTSHTFASIRPEFIDGHAFNVAIGGQSIEYDYKIFNTYKSNFKELKTIILAVSYPTLWFRLKNHKRGFSLSFNYEKYYDLEQNPSVFNLLNLEVLNRPLQINYGLIKQHYIKKKPVMISQKYGWGKKIKARPDFKASAIMQAKRQNIRNLNSDENQKKKEESISMINDIIEWSQNNDVSVILLTTPTHYEYRKRLSDKQLMMTTNTASEIANKHNNCTYINMFEDDRFMDLDFRDAHHLSPKGAAKFSKILNTKIIEFQSSKLKSEKPEANSTKLYLKKQLQ